MTNDSMSPAAQAIWEAFNEDEAGVFVDYGDKLAAALRAAADQVVPHEDGPACEGDEYQEAYELAQSIRHGFLAIADELEGGND